MKANPDREKAGETFTEVLSRRIARRSFLIGALASLPMMAIETKSASAQYEELLSAAKADKSKLGFQPITLSVEDRVIVPTGYSAKPVIRWGDPIIAGAPEFDLLNQSPESQSKQFGFNCDFVGYFPLPSFRSKSSERGLLAV
ncbi:MAG: alkaline phosphatase PhoX, partial [Acidobacteriota bacterium]